MIIHDSKLNLGEGCHFVAVTSKKSPLSAFEFEKRMKLETQVVALLYIKFCFVYPGKHDFRQTISKVRLSRGHGWLFRVRLVLGL